MTEIKLSPEDELLIKIGRLQGLNESLQRDLEKNQLEINSLSGKLFELRKPPEVKEKEQ